MGLSEFLNREPEDIGDDWLLGLLKGAIKLPKFDRSEYPIHASTLIKGGCMKNLLLKHKPKA